MPPVREKRRVDTRDKRRETTRDCRARKQRCPLEKRVSGDPLQSDRTGEEIRQFLPDLPQGLRQEERTERESQQENRGKMADPLVLPRPAKSVQNGAGPSRKT